MKTILLGKYIKRLAALNDQLCFFQFNRNELNKRLGDFGPNALQLYTTDVFAQNPMAPRLNVTLRKLPDFQKSNQTFTFGAYISTSYEVVSNYLNDSIELLSEINATNFQLTNDNQPEEKYTRTLTSTGCSPVPREVIDTLKYIRLRRNHFTHLSTSLSNQFSLFISTTGSILNTYWAGTINSLDFTNANILEFNEDETVEILEILRIIVQTLDKHLAANFSNNDIATFIAKQEFLPKPQNINNDIVRQRIKKVQNKGKYEFGVNIPESIIDPIVRIIGKK